MPIKDTDAIFTRMNLGLLRDMSKDLLDIVAKCNKESKHSLAERLDIYGKTGLPGKDGSLTCNEIVQALGTWMKTSYFRKCIAEGRFDTFKFMNLVKKVSSNEELINIANYVNPPVLLDPNDPDYVKKRFNLVPIGYGCTLPERREGKKCTLPEYQTVEDK